MKALFISEKYLKDFTAISANIDVTDLLPHIIVAQDVHIQDAIGSKLYNTLQDHIVNNTVSADEDDLIKLIRPALAYYTLYTALPFIHIKIRNKGVLKQNGENTEAVELNELKYLRGEVLDNAEFYLRRVNNYLCDNGNLFPDYKNQSGSDIMSNRRNYSCELYLGEYEVLINESKKYLG
jgi:hypothetical protein